MPGGEAGGELLEAVAAPGDEHQVGAAGGEPVGELGTEAGAGAGDQGGLVPIVVVLGDLAARGELIRDALQARPESEDPWTALINALHSVKDQAYETDEQMLNVFRMVHQAPSLRARSIEKHLQWQAMLTPEIRRRLGADPADPGDVRAEALIACVLTCLDVAGEAWARSEGSLSLVDLFDRAAAAIRG